MFDDARSAHDPAQAIGAEDLLLFIHIPKTAGSSFGGCLAKQLQPSYNINIDATRGTMPRNAAFKDEIDKFIALNKKRHFVFASGHIMMKEAVRIRESADRRTRFITMLREPAARVISDYRYQCTPAHPTHKQFREKYPNIENYVDDFPSWNKMSRFLALPGETTQATIARVETDFAFVGVVEMYSLSIRQCSKIIGTQLADGERVRVTQSTDNNAIQISDELIRTIRQLNSQDVQIWRHFRDRMRQIRDSGGHDPVLRRA